MSKNYVMTEYRKSRNGAESFVLRFPKTKNWVAYGYVTEREVFGSIFMYVDFSSIDKRANFRKMCESVLAEWDNEKFPYCIFFREVTNSDTTTVYSCGPFSNNLIKRE